MRKQTITERCTLKDLNLYNDNGMYYLKAVYFHEDDAGVYETTIPKIFLPVNRGTPSFTAEIGYCPQYLIDLGFGALNAYEKDGSVAITKTIEEKTKKMTVAEIEKKLGHKIEIISE